MNEMDGPLDGTSYYATRLLNWTSGEYHSADKWYEFLEANLKEQRKKLIELMQAHPEVFAGGSLGNLNFPIVENFSKYPSSDPARIQYLKNLSRTKGNANTTKLVSDLCDPTSISTHDLLKMGRLKDRTSEDYPEYKTLLSCVKNSLDADKRFKDNLKMVGLIGCMGLSIGPQAVYVAPFCTGLGLADAIYNVKDSHDNISLKSQVASNAQLTEAEEIAQSLADRDRSENDLINEGFFAPFIISELKDAKRMLDAAKGVNTAQDVVKAKKAQEEMEYFSRYIDDPSNRADATRIRKEIESAKTPERKAEIINENAKRITKRYKDELAELERPPFLERVFSKKKKPVDRTPAQTISEVNKLKSEKYKKLSKYLDIDNPEIVEMYYKLKKSNFEDLSSIANILGVEKLSAGQEAILEAYIRSLKRLNKDEKLKKIKEFLGGGGCGRK